MRPRVTLGNAGNQVGQLGASSASAGAFSFTDASALTVTGQVSAGGTGAAIKLQTDSLGFSTGGGLSGATVQLLPLTPSRAIELVQTTPNAGRLSITQAILNGISATQLVLGSSATTGAIVIGNSGDAISVGAPTLSLLTSGAVSEGSGAGLSVGTLTGMVNSASLSGTHNRIGAVGSFQSSAGFSLLDAQALTVSGPLSDPVSVNLTTSTGNLLLSGDVTTAALALNAAGSIQQTGGTLNASSLSGSAAGTAQLGTGGSCRHRARSAPSASAVRAARSRCPTRVR